MLFGVKNGPPTYQRAVTKTFKEFLDSFHLAFLLCDVFEFIFFVRFFLDHVFDIFVDILTVFQILIIMVERSQIGE